MNSLILDGFILVHVSDTTGVHIVIDGEIQEGNNITLECSTNATDLTFSFQSKVGENQDENVANTMRVNVLKEFPNLILFLFLFKKFLMTLLVRQFLIYSVLVLRS
ncbi:hypothetical protein DPMN_029697 [Dreissena polymorpha]|uniref:Uncharacterized protein n=1 Tax=Dreissena polymorpha TaxID=45954 RepID=A0A9D4LWW6_DREPO|nr:hypothetical protein DPMN_029697 [Dreissena polymorpha]